MPSLEYVIRPYQSPTPFGTTIIPSTLARADRATLIWGATVQGTKPQAQPAATAPGTTYLLQCCSDVLHEQRRVVDKVRINITQTDLNNGYIEVERPRVVDLQRATAKDCQTPLEQISWVNQGINSALGDLTAGIDEATSKFGSEKCGTQWNLRP